MPKHIAFVVTSLARGGMEMRLADVVNGLDRQRWNPHIYALYDRRTMQDAVAPKHLHLPISAGPYDPLPALKLARIFRQQKTSITWAMSQGFSGAWGRVGAIFAGVPIRILSIHENVELMLHSRLLNRWTDAIVAVSQDSADIIARQGIPREKIHVLYNGIDTTRYQPGADQRADFFDIPPTRKVILNVGRLATEKGRDVMLKAAARLTDDMPLIVFAGDGVERQRLEQLAASLGIAQHVRFLGLRTDVPALMRSADIVVMSSRDAQFGESCPNVVLEGMATELPVIGTAVGGTAELIVEGETGYVIPPEDVDALAQRLRELLDNAELRRHMGIAGRQRVMAQFSIQQMLAGREQLFETLMERKGIL